MVFRTNCHVLKPKILELKGVIVGVVLSINHNIDIPNMNRDYMPGVMDVKANVLKQGKTLLVQC